MLTTQPLLPLAAGVTLLFIVVLYFALRTQNSQTRKTILLLGISDAGKSALYTFLRSGQMKPTVTSMQENEGAITLNSKSYDIVDVPGHERVRSRYAHFLPVTRAIVFVVDATNISQQIRLVAEYLYNVLSHPHVQSARLPVLVALNKSEKLKAATADKAQRQLEEEIHKLRKTRGAAVEDQDGDDEKAYLGYENEAFRFEHVENKVDFVTCSAKEGKIDDIKDWLIEQR